MRILVVGTGSIGQLYGHCLDKGGATVDAWVKPEYADEARDGYVLYDRSDGFDDPTRFAPASVYTSPQAIQGEDIDAAVLCIPSNGLRGEWFQEFAAATGDATIVSLTPALEDRRFITEYVDPRRAAFGMITAVAYPAPMEGETAPQPGTAYWLPPLTPAYFEGPERRLAPVMSALQRGGMRTRRTDDLARRADFGAAVLMPFVASLETSDWSLSKLRSDRETRKLLAEATDEALEAVESRLDKTRPFSFRLLSPTTFKGVLMVAPVVPPFDLEGYLRVHFTKVGDQTRLMLEEYIEQRRREQLDAPALERLLEAIGSEPEGA